MMFNYESAAAKAGFYLKGNLWINGGWPEEKDKNAFEGTAKQLCWYLGIGPEWEEWKQKPYAMEKIHENGWRLLKKGTPSLIRKLEKTKNARSLMSS